MTSTAEGVQNSDTSAAAAGTTMMARPTMKAMLPRPRAQTACQAAAGAPEPSLSMAAAMDRRSEEHTSELQSLMRISYAVLCLKKKNTQNQNYKPKHDITINHT